MLPVHTYDLVHLWMSNVSMIRQNLIVIG